MTPEEAKPLINMIAENQPITAIDRAAWQIVLTDWTSEAAVCRLAELKTRQRFVNPCDLNQQPDGELGWSEAWPVFAANWPRLGTTGDYGHPVINQVAYDIRNMIRTASTEQAKWIFRDAWGAATNPASPAVMPALTGGPAKELRA